MTNASACSCVSATYSASYVVVHPSCSASSHARRRSTASPRRRIGIRPTYRRRSRPTSAGISPRRTASYSADSVWERRSVGARSLCLLATSASVSARWRTAPASTTNLVIAAQRYRRRRGRSSPARRSRARRPSSRRRRPARPERRARAAPRRSARRAARPPRAPPRRAKLGRLPFAVSAMSVNWETTSAEPPVSRRLRSKRPVLVREDPQPGDLAGQPDRLGLAVAGGDTEQDAEPRPDLGHRPRRRPAPGPRRPAGRRPSWRAAPSPIEGRVETAADPPHLRFALARRSLPACPARHAAPARRACSPPSSSRRRSPRRTRAGTGSARSSSRGAGSPPATWPGSSPSSTTSSIVDLGSVQVDTAAARLLPEKYARRYEAIPIRFLERRPRPRHRRRPDERPRLRRPPPRPRAQRPPRRVGGTGRRRRRSTASTAAARSRSGSAATTGAAVRRATSAGRAATSAPAINLVNSLISRAIDEGASDLHFEPQAKQLVVRVRIDGVMRKLATIPQDAPAGRDEPPEDHGRARHRRAPRPAGRPHVDPRTAAHPMDLRVAVLPTTHGEQVVLRIMNRAAAAGSGSRELGMSPDAEERVRARDPAAVRRRARRRPDRLRQDDDALRRARRPQRRRSRR